MEDGRNLEIGSSSSMGTKAYPAGFLVLVVDDDPICLKIVETMLRTSQNEVVATSQPMEALNLLRERESRFDLVLTDVYMPGMDGFELLDHIRREFNIPVIMMSVDDQLKVITRGLESGACFYISKPITLNDMRNIWQHVFRRRVNRQNTEQAGSVREVSPLEKVMGDDDKCASSSKKDDNQTHQEGKRKMPKESDKEEEDGNNDSMSEKKARVIWNYELHNKFLEAINQLGLDKAVPKKILELMDDPRITRENVASHLQKYRLFIKRNKEKISRTMEPTPPLRLTNGPFNSSRPLSHPLLMFNSRQGYAQFPNQQRSWMPLQQGIIRSNIQGITTDHMHPIGPTYFLNQEVSSRNSLAPSRHEQSFSMNNQRNLHQPLIGNFPSLNQQNVSNYSALGVEPYRNIISAPFYGNNSTGYERGNDTIEMDYQRTQKRPRNLGNGPLDHNFSTFNLQGQNNLLIGGTKGVENIGSFGNFYQGQGSNYSYNNHIGTQITSPVSQVGLNVIGNESSNRVDWNFNGVNSCYGTQSLASSSGFLNGNRFSTVLTDVVAQQEQPQQLQAPPLDQQQHGGDDIDSYLSMLRGHCTYIDGENYFSQPLIEGENENNLIFNHIDQGTNQQQEGERL